MRRAVIVLSIAFLCGFSAPNRATGADKKLRFAAGPAASYASHVTQEKITIGVMPYTTPEQSELAFGKVKPFEHGILPVLVVVQNDTGKALRVDLKAEFIAPSGQHVDAMPPDDVKRFEAIKKRPGMKPPVAPIPLPRGVKKGPLNAEEIDGRAFAVKLIPPGESASGFVYFESDIFHGATLYLDGFRDAATSKAYFYFEIPLDSK